MDNEEKKQTKNEFEITGFLVQNGIKISENKNINILSSKGYGPTQTDYLLLTFYEALYLYIHYL